MPQFKSKVPDYLQSTIGENNLHLILQHLTSSQLKSRVVDCRSSFFFFSGHEEGKNNSIPLKLRKAM